MIKKADIIYVSIQSLLFVLFIIPVRIFPISIFSAIRYSGIILSGTGILIAFIALLQLNKFLTAFPTPKKHSKLLQAGIYKFIRHPIYSGIILTTLGNGFYSESLWKILIAVVLWILFYFKSKYEETLLMQHFADYEAYQKVSGRFFPFI